MKARNAGLAAPGVLLALAALIWAGNQVLGRAVAGHVPPVGLAWSRWAVALVLLLPLTLRPLWAARGWLRGQAGLLLLAGICGVATFNTLFYLALQGTQAINGAIANSLIPVAILILAWAWDGERPRPRQVAGLALSLAGVLVILSGGDPDAVLRLAFSHSDLLLLVAVMIWAVYSLTLRRLKPPPGLGPLGLLAATILFGLPPLSLWWAAEIATNGLWPPLDAGGVASILYTGVLASLVAFLCWNRGVALLGPAAAGRYLHLIPVFGTALAVALLGERPGWFHAVGLALILGGVALARAARPPIA